MTDVEVHAWRSTVDLSKIAPALVAALGSLEDVARTRKAELGTYGYSYADLAAVLTKARPILAEHGLVVMQFPVTTGDYVEVTTLVVHNSGQWIEGPPFRLPAGNTAQNAGSAVTYGRRYALMAMLGLATEDDDGRRATEDTGPRFLTTEESELFTKACHDAHLTKREVGDLVFRVTEGRTRDPRDAWVTEVDALNAALAAVEAGESTPGVSHTPEAVNEPQGDQEALL